MQRDQTASRASGLECSPNEGMTLHQTATGCSVVGREQRNVPQAAIGGAYPNTLHGRGTLCWANPPKAPYLIIPKSRTFACTVPIPHLDISLPPFRSLVRCHCPQKAVSHSFGGDHTPLPGVPKAPCLITAGRTVLSSLPTACPSPPPWSSP